MPYYKADVQKIREDMNRGAKLWKPKSGENRIRILPPWSPEGRFYKLLVVHFRVGLDNRILVCPRKTPPRKSPCAICEFIEAKLHSSSLPEQDMARQMLPRQQFLYNIVDLKEPEKGVQVYASGVKVWNWLVNYFNNEEFGDFTDPDNGRTVIITKIGEGKQVEYTVALSPRQTPLDNPAWLDQLHNLDTFIPVPTYEETKEALTGLLAESMEQEEEEEDPALSFGPFPEPESQSAGLPSCFGRYNGGPKCLEECEVMRECVGALKAKAKVR